MIMCYYTIMGTFKVVMEKPWLTQTKKTKKKQKKNKKKTKKQAINQTLALKAVAENTLPPEMAGRI